MDPALLIRDPTFTYNISYAPNSDNMRAMSTRTILNMESAETKELVNTISEFLVSYITTSELVTKLANILSIYDIHLDPSSPVERAIGEHIAVHSLNHLKRNVNLFRAIYNNKQMTPIEIAINLFVIIMKIALSTRKHLIATNNYSLNNVDDSVVANTCINQVLVSLDDVMSNPNNSELCLYIHEYIKWAISRNAIDIESINELIEVSNELVGIVDKYFQTLNM